MKEQRDHIDRFLDELEPVEGLDYEVEGIVDRIGGLNRRIKRGMEATLTEFGMSLPDWQVLSTLRNSGSRTPGVLARHLELSSGAMTSRLDSLEEAGLIMRVPDPDDRRSVVVELTPDGRVAWEKAASIQARKEAFFASALSPAEQKRLNALLRKLMLAFEAAERGA
jgi:DNA-binding MarR family transcriptional regulator